MASNSRSFRCCFCGADHTEVELLFVAPIGGFPPNICSGCVEGFAGAISAHRRNVVAAAHAVAADNSVVTRAPAERRL